MNISSKTSWITRTAILIALLITWQMFMGRMTGNNQLIVGTGVNLMLAISVMTGGLWSGVAVGMLSPVFARFLGIGPLWAIVPVIMIGNLAFAILWHLIGNFKIGSKQAYSYIIAAPCAALVKFLILYLGVSHVVIPMFLNIPEQQANAISNVFGITQFITASLGGVVACAMLPLLRNAIGKDRYSHRT